MDDIKIHLLEDVKDKLVKDLHVDAILKPLYERNVISTDEYEDINALNGDNEKARCLIDILKQKENSAYDIFCEVLKKDYKWLAEELLYHNYESNERLNIIEDRIYSDTVTIANIPRKPPHYIVRTRKLEELKSLLRNMQKKDYVTLHGMPLIGKSCLAMAAVLDRELLKNSFKNRVFWINVGDSPNDNYLITNLLRLHQSITLSDNRNIKNKNSATANRQSINVTDDLFMIRNILRKEFTEEPLREALLILDDVHSKRVIDAFKLDCKTLVITRDKNVVPKSDNHFLELKEGFTEDETLQLFADCIKVEKNKLPPQAHKFNRLCKGIPMLIALVGSLLEEYKEDAKNNPKRWDYYLQKLQNYDLENFQIKLSKAISMCIENLDEQLQKYYKTLVLFLEDVNIMPATLQIIWSLDKTAGKYKVEEIMTKFNQKSLVVSSYNQQLKTYVYGIHDLFLIYLKKQLSSDEIKNLHRDLISKYRDKCNNQFSNLPNDNYIFSYIGHHLYKAELWDDFPKIYFDLNFLSAKIKAVGPTDLLTDFKEYRDQITNNDPNLIAKLEEFEQFVQDYGQELHKFSKLDIVQCALNQTKLISVHKQAIEIANSRPDQLYFQLLCEQQIVCKQKTIDFPEPISAACFTRNMNNILVGYKSGKIEVWDQNYKNHIHTFYGHKQSIKSFMFHPTNFYQFLSVSMDGSVKLWSLDGIVTFVMNGNHFVDNTDHVNNQTTPRVKQPHWVDMGFDGAANNIKDNSLITYKSENAILCATFSNDGELILTGSDHGDVFIWQTNTGKKLNEIEDIVDTDITCCQFSIDDTLVLYSCEMNIFICSAATGKQLYSFKCDRDILAMYTIPDYNYNKLLTISEDLLTLWSWENGQFDEEFIGTSSTTYKQDKFKINGKIYISGTITSDGNYIAVVDHSKKVQIWNINKKQAVQEMLDCNGEIIYLDTYMTDNNSINLLITTSDSIKYWTLFPEDLVKLKKNKLKELFAVNYENENIPKLAVVDIKNNIYIYKGLIEQIKIPTNHQQLHVTFLTYYKNKLAVGYDNGTVSEYEFPLLVVPKDYKIMSIVDEKIVYLEYLNEHTLVAAGKGGSLMIRDKKINKKLIDGKSTLSKNDYRAPIIKCYLWHDALRFLSITKDCKVKCWALLNVTNGSNLENILIVPFDNCSITMTALTQCQDRIAFTFESGGFHIYNLHITADNILEAPLNQKQQNLSDKSKSTSCCFSSDGTLLAVGQESGQIILWDIDHMYCLATLNLHRSSVRNLHFSPSIFPMIMISVGEQIGWWDITYIKRQKEFEKNKRGSGRFQLSRSQQNLNNNLERLRLSATIDDIWQSKVGKKQLLATLKPRGTHTTHIEASNDFTSFTMVDDFGLIYIMDIYKPNQ